MPLDDSEKQFLRKAQRYFNVKAVEVEDSTCHDIAIRLPTFGPPTIMLGRVFQTSSPRLRMQKLTHELLHTTGLAHDRYARSRGYFSSPRRDTLSPRVYRDIMSGSKSFDPARFDLEV